MGRLGIGNKSDVIGEVVSVGRGDTWAMKTGARGATGEESTGTTGTLAMRLISASGTVGEGVWAGDNGTSWAQQMQTGLCSRASCTGLGKGSGLGTPWRAFRKQSAHCLYKTV